MDWEQVRAIIEALAASGYLDLRKVGEFSAATGLVGGPRIHRKIQRALASIDL
jgi:hypothetical protein